LERIARAASESAWSRVGALRALYRIDPEHAGRIAQELIDGELLGSQDEPDREDRRAALRAMALRDFEPKWTRDWFDAVRGRTTDCCGV
jgi:hypothetical protein